MQQKNKYKDRIKKNKKDNEGYIQNIAHSL